MPVLRDRTGLVAPARMVAPWCGGRTKNMAKRLADRIIGHARIIARISFDQFRVEIISGPVGKQYLLHSREIRVSDAIGSEGLLVIRKVGTHLTPQLLPD